MKVLFIDKVHPILEQRLVEAGYICDSGEGFDREKILNIIKNYQGIVIRSRTKVDQEFLDQAKTLKFIARSGAGLENINLEYAVQLGVEVFNSPEGNKDAVGEQAIGMLMMLFNNLKRADEEVRNGIWKREENRGLELAGKTIAIFGYGNMGSAFAEKLKGFSCKIIAYDKYKLNFGNDFVVEVTLEEVFQQADIVSLHLPYTEETHHLFDTDFINHFVKPIYVINTARGLNINTVDLVNALRNDKVLGACLDVLEYEKSSFEKLETEDLPEAFKYLIHSERTVLSPHIAGWTEESYVKLSTFLADKIIAKFGIQYA